MTDFFSGAILDRQLEMRGFARQPAETDWEFRKRVFPDLHAHSTLEAAEFLLGTRHSGFDDYDRTMFMEIHRLGGRDQLVAFADGFTADPISSRTAA